MCGNITAKADVRMEAVRIAATMKNVTSENIIEVSNSIASFVVGDANIPESYNQTECMSKLLDSLADMRKNSNEVAPAIGTSR